jgi:F-type H+-transporting ATPase subunit b
VEINSTLLIQLGIYLALIFILKGLFFDPILALLRKREALTTGKKGEALGMREKISQLKAEYEAKMSDVKKSIDLQRRDELGAIRERAEKKLNDAKTKADRKLMDHQLEMEAEIKRLRGQLPQLSADISSEISKAIIGAKVVRL